MRYKNISFNPVFISKLDEKTFIHYIGSRISNYDIKELKDIHKKCVEKYGVKQEKIQVETKELKLTVETKEVKTRKKRAKNN